MADYETKNMTGSAFKNRNRRSDNDSNYTGTVKINDQEYWINVWVKKTKDGDPWFSYSFREKKPMGGAPKKDDVILDADIPF